MSNASSLQYLEELDLSENPLLTIPDFGSMNTLQPPLSVNVTEVPLVCDGCAAWMQARPTVTYINPVCSQPERLVGVNVLNIQEGNFLQGICPGQYV